MQSANSAGSKQRDLFFTWRHLLKKELYLHVLEELILQYRGVRYVHSQDYCSGHNCQQPSCVSPSQTQLKKPPQLHLTETSIFQEHASSFTKKTPTAQPHFRHTPGYHILAACFDLLKKVT